MLAKDPIAVLALVVGVVVPASPALTCAMDWLSVVVLWWVLLALFATLPKACAVALAGCVAWFSSSLTCPREFAS